MPAIVIEGGNKLEGTLKVQGAKNGVLPLLAATILCSGECVIHNCPKLSDVDVSIKILRQLGCKCSYDNSTVTVDTTNMSGYEIPDSLMREMRSSIVFLGAIAARAGKARMSSPGGCELGPRPIDIHLSALRDLGIEINENGGFVECECADNLTGKCISLSFPSVGATENIILASVLVSGCTVIHNCAKEPEIVDLAQFLNIAGAKINGAGTDTIYIEGVPSLHSATYSVLPDRIATATFLAAAAVTKGDITLENTEPSHLVSVLNVYRSLGCVVDYKDKTIRVRGPQRLQSISTIRSYIYPGFPTDAGPMTVAAMALSTGTSMFVENIFENRFRYIDELNRFGTSIKVEGKVAVIEGVRSLKGAGAVCTDLRGGAAVVIAALAAEGKSVIDNIYHIDRGYEEFEKNLASLGANAKRIE